MNRWWWGAPWLLLLAACAGGGDDGGSARGGSGTEIVVPDEPVPGISSDCGSVRLTEYWSTDRGWCEFSSASDILPDFVRAGLTLAIAEPYDNGSYGGDPGEACGECWEIDTITRSAIVMVHDLCPIEGNPLCAGGHFHFDLTPEAAAAVEGGGLDEASARRVPCPVTGNIHAEIIDRNEWGYVRLAFVNHRFPIRTAEYRAVDGDDWRPVQRSGGAWHVLDDNTTFAAGAPGGVFRFVSATGEAVEGTATLTEDVGVGELFDTDTRFAEAEATGESCVFVPPGDVYDEGWGGIDQVRWAPNPWGDATASETSDGCADDSASCVRIGTLQQWDGFHLYYRQAFPTATFSRLTLALRARSGGGEFGVAPSHEGEECEATVVEVGAEWTRVEIDVAAACSSLDLLNEVTVSNHGAATDLLIDEVRFE
jgi:hypothetical protein